MSVPRSDHIEIHDTGKPKSPVNTGIPELSEMWLASPGWGQAEQDNLVVLNPQAVLASLHRLVGVGEQKEWGRQSLGTQSNLTGDSGETAASRIPLQKATLRCKRGKSRVQPRKPNCVCS